MTSGQMQQQPNTSIASITIAYNGEGYLRKHLDALLGQSRPLSEIIVVNNASTDGTLGLVSQEYPQVTLLNLPTNVGVGGGYAAGFEYALKSKHHDWVWVFDQDSLPKHDALKRLLEAVDLVGEKGSELGIAAPLSVHSETQRHYRGLLWRNGWQRVPAYPKTDVSFVDAVISSGSLIRRMAVQTAGPPRADFFMDYIDLEHCLRLRRSGYKIAVVRRSVLEHALGDPKIVKISGITRVWADHVPWREYYKARNEVFTVWSFYPDWRSKLSVVRRFARHALGILLFGKEKLACLKMMYLGIVDGRAGRLGIRNFEDSRINNQPFSISTPGSSHA
jgi:GT2 family glycosyltransferase